MTPNIAMDSGFCDSFTSGGYILRFWMNFKESFISGLNSSRETKLVLEKFLDYTQFPRGRRIGIIDNFLAQLQTEDLWILIHPVSGFDILFISLIYDFET